MELIKNIYQIKIPLSGVKIDSGVISPFRAKKENFIDNIEQNIIDSIPLSHINVYLIEGKNGNMLVDTGWNTPDAYSTLTTELKNFGFGIKDITHIVITHIHPDHCGLAGKIKQISDARVFINELEAGMLTPRYIDIDRLLEETHQFLITHGVPENEAPALSRASLPARELFAPIDSYDITNDGYKIPFEPFEFTVMTTPGHSPGHITLYESSKKLLFTGDFILPEITTNISLHPQSGPDPLGAYFEALERVYHLEVNFVFPGHGPAFSGLKQIIESIVRHHRERRNDILKTIEGNSKTAYQIAQEIPWMGNTTEKKFQHMNILDKRLAITESIAHLENMVKEKEIGKSIENGKVVYFA